MLPALIRRAASVDAVFAADAMMPQLAATHMKILYDNIELRMMPRAALNSIPDIMMIIARYFTRYGGAVVAAALAAITFTLI